jgi:hypothetical protein
MSYGVTYKLNLDQFSPSDVIELHQQGIITMDEIIESGRPWNTFGDELKEYVYAWTSARNAQRLYTMEATIRSETRMITHVDRKLRATG